MYSLLFALSLTVGIPSEAERAQMVADGILSYIAPATDDSNACLTVRKWKFAPSGTGWRTVTFVVEPQGETMEDTRIDTRYEAPLTLHVKRMRSIVLRWPRVDGKPPEKSCAVHHEKMHIEMLPIVWTGIPVGDPDGALWDEWERAFLTDFTNSGESIGRGDDMIPQKFGEAFICESCQKAYKAWLAAHHLDRPPR